MKNNFPRLNIAGLLILFLVLVVGLVVTNQAVAMPPGSILPDMGNLSINPATDPGHIIYLPHLAQTGSQIVFIPAGEFQMGCDPAHNAG